MMTDILNTAFIIKTLGRGKKGTRDLTHEEAYFVMKSILNETITGPQLGAFLMLMRVKEETAIELAGMASAVDGSLDYQPKSLVDVNWPAYAGKKKQPSWYILSAKLLAQNGIKILIHGGGQHTEGRQYARQACDALGIFSASKLKNADELIKEKNICYISLSDFCSELSNVIDMKAELGLRSPAHSLVRHLNPLKAKVTLQGMFHPAYMPLHHDTANILEQTKNIVLKGDGGEFEVRPDSKTAIKINHEPVEANLTETVEPILSQRSIRPNEVSIKPLIDLWNGTRENEYGEAAIVQTAALVLSQVRDISFEEAKHVTNDWWSDRLS